MKNMTQRDYNEVCDGLDDALGVFLRQQMTEVEAQAALKDFVDTHYFQVWRAMNR